MICRRSCDEAHEIHDVFRRTRKALAQLRILGRDTRGTGVEVADAHHDAADRHQRRRGEPELLGPQQRGDGDVTTGLQLAIGLHGDAAAQVVQHQGLVGLRQTQLPGQPRVRDGGLW
jgi:hypothetical protein